MNLKWSIEQLEHISNNGRTEGHPVTTPLQELVLSLSQVCTDPMDRVIERPDADGV